MNKMQEKSLNVAINEFFMMIEEGNFSKRTGIRYSAEKGEFYADTDECAMRCGDPDATGESSWVKVFDTSSWEEGEFNEERSNELISEIENAASDYLA